MCEDERRVEGAVGGEVATVSGKNELPILPSASSPEAKVGGPERRKVDPEVDGRQQRADGAGLHRRLGGAGRSRRGISRASGGDGADDLDGSWVRRTGLSKRTPSQPSI